MADPSSPLEFEDVPLDQARLMGRGPRMEFMLYETLRQKIQDLSTAAVRIHLGPEITSQRMKNYILRMAASSTFPSPSGSSIRPSSRSDEDHGGGG